MIDTHEQLLFVDVDFCRLSTYYFFVITNGKVYLTENILCYHAIVPFCS